MDEDEATKRILKLTETVRNLSQQIDWLVPFLNKRAKESGDVAGIQLNARQASEDAKRLIHTYEVIAVAKATELATGAAPYPIENPQ
jgi:hypothetical protein